MSNSEAKEKIKQQYLEAVKLYVWYSPSKFSFFQNKTSKELSERYRVLSQTIWEEYINYDKNNSQTS